MSHVSERGSAALEIAVAVPLLMVLVLLAAAGGRIAIAQGSVQQAAADAARAASIARTPGDASSTAQASAAATLSNQGLHCISNQVAVDVSGFGVAVGHAATVTATVSCSIRLSDLAIPGLPATKVLSASASSPLDTYRGRS